MKTTFTRFPDFLRKPIDLYPIRSANSENDFHLEVGTCKGEWA